MSKELIGRITRRLKDMKWWVQCRFHTKYRMHVINTGLEPGWHDEDQLILYACMAMLCRYIEWHGTEEDIEAFNAELRDPGIDPNSPDELKHGQADRQEEALAIYRWWKKEKPLDEDRRTEMVMALHGNPCKVPEGDRKQYHAELDALQTKIDDDEQSMLHRLIDIRRSLWT